MCGKYFVQVWDDCMGIQILPPGAQNIHQLWPVCVLDWTVVVLGSPCRLAAMGGLVVGLV